MVDTELAHLQQANVPPHVTHISLQEPFDGWAMPISEIPDAVFSSCMLGNGIGIDPSGAVRHAPCQGTVTMIHRAHHALTLAAQGGPDILMHIGIDTVSLGRDGFAVHVTEGQLVAAGDPLISFDMGALAQRVPSLISPIIITGTELVVMLGPAAERIARQIRTIGDDAPVPLKGAA